jgi:hypothetical protein
MALENATFINGLNASNPLSTDNVSQADDHIRLIKTTVKATFPNVTGAVTKTHTQLNNTLDKTGDTMTGPLTLSGAPASNLQAATKLYVDTADATKANTSTTVTAGTGLTGGGDLSANRTISIANSGVSTAQLADSGVTTAKIADAAVTPAKLASGAAVSNIGYTPVNPSEFTGANQSLATTGYQKLPGGIIIQWGRATSTSGSGLATLTNNFPIAFSAVYSFVATHNGSGTIDGDWAATFTDTQYGARHRTGAYPYSWIAIGV